MGEVADMSDESAKAPDVPTGVMSDEEFQDTFGSGPPEGEIT